MDGLCKYVLVIVRIPFLLARSGMLEWGEKKRKKKRQVECMVQRSEIGAEVVKPSLFPFFPR